MTDNNASSLATVQRPSLGFGTDSAPIASPAHSPKASLIPIRSLGEKQRGQILDHLLALDERDRYLRFGYAAQDEQIGRYVSGLDFSRDEIYGIFNRKLQLIAMAHLAVGAGSGQAVCEFGVSVAKAARGRGYGGLLFDRAVTHARNAGATQMYIHALSENTAMLRIATKAGAQVERDGSETECHLSLPPATLDTRMAEIVQQHLADVDYRMKVQAKSFWSLMRGLQWQPQHS